MRVVLVSSADIAGGAARSAYRLHASLRELGVDSRMVVNRKESGDPDVYGPRTEVDKLVAAAVRRADRIPLQWPGARPETTWSVEWLPNGTLRRIRALRPDVVHLHWIGQGFVPIPALSRIRSALVWTLHDMWPFTGGCHYDGGCGRYQERCGSCPQLASKRTLDLSAVTWRAKRHYWSDIGIVIVAPSRWLADCARASSLFGGKRIEIIPYGVDLDCYRPVQKAIARNALGLRQDVLLVAIAGTDDPRKGMRHVLAALEQLEAQCGTAVHLAAFGETDPSLGRRLPVPTHYLGSLHDDVSLKLMYSAADVFVQPSQQDNLANTVLEALACGTPCVAFSTGGMPDLIDHKETGYLARPFETSDLAQGISWVLGEPQRRITLGANARAKAEREFAAVLQARRYERLYHDLLANSKPRA